MTVTQAVSVMVVTAQVPSTDGSNESRRHPTINCRNVTVGYTRLENERAEAILSVLPEARVLKELDARGTLLVAVDVL